MKERKKVLRLIIVLVCIVFFMISILVVFSIISSNNSSDNVSSEEFHRKTLDDVKQEEIQELKNMGERARIQFYIGKFFKYLEKTAYYEAYDLLNEEFKATYFPSIDKFVEYIPNTYNLKSYAIEYTNLERLGDIYVVWLNIIDPINGKRTDEKVTQNFVVKERNLNDFEISFSVQGGDNQ